MELARVVLSTCMPLQLGVKALDAESTGNESLVRAASALAICS